MPRATAATATTAGRRRQWSAWSCGWPCHSGNSHHWYHPVAPSPEPPPPPLDAAVALGGPSRRWWWSSGRCVRRAAQALCLGGALLGVVALGLGVAHEQYQVRLAPDTLGFYNQPNGVVCGILRPRVAAVNTATNTTTTSPAPTAAAAASSNTTAAASSTTSTTSTTSSSAPPPPPPLVRIETFASVAAVTATNTTVVKGVVAHCGACGACSAPPDVRRYDETRHTLLRRSTVCARRALFGGRQAAAQCLDETVGFTAGCNDCWVDNILCDLRLCVYTCLWYGLFRPKDGGVRGSGAAAGGAAALNPCTTCDEKRCGPAFVQCAGANRRRAGIESDIARNAAAEVCPDVTDRWWDDPDLQRQWLDQQSAAVAAADADAAKALP